MKKIISCLIMLMISFNSIAETITIFSPYNPSHSGSVAFFEIVNKSNELQTKFKFVIEFKPGGEQIIAMNNLNDKPHSSLAIIAPKFVEHVISGKLKKTDYLPVHSLGYACWGVITNIGNESDGIKSLKGTKEMIVGGVGIGNSTHLTSLIIGEKFGISIRYIPFKSNNDALVSMVGNNGVNMVIDRVENYISFRKINPNIKLLAVSCPNRIDLSNSTKTLSEQNIPAPYIWNITVSHKDMSDEKRKELSKILNDATIVVGKSKIQHISGFVIQPDGDDFLESNFKMLENLIGKYKTLL